MPRRIVITASTDTPSIDGPGGAISVTVSTLGASITSTTFIA